jgi:methylthioribose-1-phosphate isomerase
VSDFGIPPIETVRWCTERQLVRILDQRRLPQQERYVEIRTVARLIWAIRSLAVRGAPALGIAGAYGVALAAYRALDAGKDPLRSSLAAARHLAAARPTAVNLRHGIDAAIRLVRTGEGARPEAAGDRILAEDLAASRAMAEHGCELIPAGSRVLTHCNTGGLATGGLGTALAVICLAASRGRVLEVLADETRPLMQGNRLTLWELRRLGIPARVLPDGAAAWALKTLGIGCVMTGADRIVANGDTANKIGTYGLALAAAAHKIPFYVVAPTTTFDLSIPDGTGIPIEERHPDEVLRAGGWCAGRGVSAREGTHDGPGAFNPAFDVTPAGLIAGWVTERGIETPPFAPVETT